MADESTAQAPTSFAEFEAGGGTYNPPSPPGSKSEPEPESSAALESQTAAEPDTAEPEPEQDQEETQPPPKQKRTLSSDHEKMLKEVKEMRREKRELQQELQQLRQPAPPSAQSTPSPQAEEDKEPVRPSLDSWQDTLAAFDEANRKYDQDLIALIEKRIAKREQARLAEEHQQRISNAYNEKLAAHIKDHPEYGEQIQQIPMSDLMINMVFTEGPALGQALIDRQDEARRIKALPHDVQIFEMGVLFGSIKKNGKVKSNPVPEEEEEPSPPVKVPAKLTASSAPNAAKGADHGAKNYAQWEAAELRLAQSNLKRR